MSENTITLFLDAVGRTIIGETVSSDDTTLTVKNPAVVAVHPNPQTGQLQLQILPIIFREFLADKNSPTTWKYNRSKITAVSDDAVLDFKIAAQYQQIFAGGTVVPPSADEQAAEGSGDVIRLFDEE